jgi:adenylate cyclase
MVAKVKTAALTAFLLGLVGLTLHLTPAGRNLEEDLDLRALFHLRGRRAVPPEVAIVSLDRESARELALPVNPVKWPRTLYARLTEALYRGGASVIVYDIYFGEPTSEEDDQTLAGAFSLAGNVLVCEHLKHEALPISAGSITRGTLHLEKALPPIPCVAGTAAALAPYPLPKVPMLVRQAWRFKTEAGCMPTLPFVAFQLFSLDHHPELISLLESASPQYTGIFPCNAEEIRARRNIGRISSALRTTFEGDRRLAGGMLDALQRLAPDAGDAEKTKRLRAMIHAYTEPDSVFLNFYGPPGTIPTVPSHRVIKLQNSSSDLSGFAGKAVFVGVSELRSPENRDGFHTVFSNAEGVDLSGVEIAATAFANLLEDMPVRPAAPTAFVGMILAWGLALGCVSTFLPPVPGLALMVGLLAAYGLAALNLFTERGVWLPLTVIFAFQAPLALCSAFVHLHAGVQKERARIRKAFGFFLPDHVIDRIIADMREAKDIALTHQTVFGAVLCSDGSQYSALSEKMGPHELSTFLNQYYEAAFRPVKANKGIVSDIIGDSMLAVWAGANPNPALKRNACQAALEIMEEIDHFNSSSGEHKLHTRIGIHCGELLLGNVGGSGHFEYRPVGDVVNTASRIEGLNKSFGTRILVSKEAIDDIPDFLTRELGRFRLYGKANPVTVYELICPLSHATKIQRDSSALFSEALKAFRARLWDRAEHLFQEYIHMAGEDEAARHYQSICARFREHPPDDAWDGMVCCEKK